MFTYGQTMLRCYSDLFVFRSWVFVEPDAVFCRAVYQYSRTVFPNLKKSSHTLLSSYSRKVKWGVARELSSWAVHHRTDGCRGICWPSLGYLHLTWVPSKILRLRCSEFPIDAMAFTPVIPTLPMTLQYNLNHWDDQALMEQRQGYWMSHASKML